jgi:hypothetical protein
MGRWVRIDRRYNQPYRLTPASWRVILKWAGLLGVVIALASISGDLAWWGVTGLVIYFVYRTARSTLSKQALNGPRRGEFPPYQANIGSGNRWQFNPPPGWPAPPAGWTPPPGWQADPSWPLPPLDWQFWIPAQPTPGAPGERNSRVIPQDVKIAVAVRDKGQCVQCGSPEELHYDHKIPWSRGGTNTVNNIQLLCGRCNRIKGADDIPL